MKAKYPIVIVAASLLIFSGCPQKTETESPSASIEQLGPLIAPDAKVEKLASGFQFTEGPAADAKGNIYFSDIPNKRIHIWSIDGKLSTFIEDTGSTNGLFFDKKGNLYACANGDRQLIVYDSNGNRTMLADKYQQKRLNSPNDLWLDPKGGIYFTDPRYGDRDGLELDGEHVYYLTPDRKNLIRVVDDFVRPNGIIGTPDGKKIYITDRAGSKTYIYDINDDGTLTGKKFFAPQGSDGMTLDSRGNLYITVDAVSIYDPQGNHIQDIPIPERPANVTFGSPDNRTLFITARTSLYSIRMNVSGLQ